MNTDNSDSFVISPEWSFSLINSTSMLLSFAASSLKIAVGISFSPKVFSYFYGLVLFRFPLR